MGFFSQDCIAPECGESIVCPYDIPKGMEWQNEAVCISPDGEFVMGKYDGYGRVAGAEEAIAFDNTVWHRRCWEAAGKPMEYRGPSKHSSDQGFFYDRKTARRTFSD